MEYSKINLEMRNSTIPIKVFSKELIANNHYNYRDMNFKYMLLTTDVSSMLEEIKEIYSSYSVISKNTIANTIENDKAEQAYYITLEYCIIFAIYGSILRLGNDDEGDDSYVNESIGVELGKVSELLGIDISRVLNVNIIDIEDMILELLTITSENFIYNYSINKLYETLDSLNITEFTSINIINKDIIFVNGKAVAQTLIIYQDGR